MRSTILALGFCALVPVFVLGAACDGGEDGTSGSGAAAGSGAGATTGSGSGGGGGEATTGSGGAGGAGGAGGGAADPGPNVDLSDPQLYEFTLSPDDLDPEVDGWISDQFAYLDTRVTPVGSLVVYLAGAGGTPSGTRTMQQYLAGLGFHVISPHYANDYGIGDVCGNDPDCYGEVRLEAFEGVDHHAGLEVSRANSLEERAARMLAYLAENHPQGDWGYFLKDDVPRWEKVVVSGISHGASSSGVIGKARAVERVVSLSGPLDRPGGQPATWELAPSETPLDRFFGFTHTADSQHPGHLDAFETMGLVGEPTSVDGAAAPYGGSHRLTTSAPTGDGHGSTQAGGASPKDGDAWVFDPVWRTMYGVQ